MFLKDINGLPQEEWTNKNKPLVCSFKERQVEDRCQGKVSSQKKYMEIK